MNSRSEGSEIVTVTPGKSINKGRLHQAKCGGGPEFPEILQQKKRCSQRSLGGQGGKGLRHFSLKVCEKVRSKGRTTYNEVADELVAEFASPQNANVSPDQHQYDDKNIRRRVYDALNVLMAMEIIFKDKKCIQWKGLPSTNVANIEELKSAMMQLEARIARKATYINELEEQILGLENLVQRNKRIYNSCGQFPAGGIALPFILVQTQPHATVEIEISEDMQVVHFEFNSTPFELHDDTYVLKAMSSTDKTIASYADMEIRKPTFDINEPLESPYNSISSSATLYSMPDAAVVTTTTSPPFPTTLKSHLKQENNL
ncbi:hypothetical protein O6H91_07G099200 [Diphasiastrum complanatum]|uniref:Uncharacterized protein n=1 Tax=Diphasiastrum complanatum TaxID=34168 RepID=A0ACC2D810_DIPCM|nr:hypothetical protein O6H91_07G099200 [Diphasiastrum complanatum]